MNERDQELLDKQLELVLVLRGTAAEQVWRSSPYF